MKTNKASGFIMLVLTLIFAVIGVVLFLLPESVSTVTVTDGPRGYKSGNDVRIRFTLKNEGEEDVTITYFAVTVSTNAGIEQAVASDESDKLTIKANASQECYIEYPSDNYPNEITKITIEINGDRYTVYGGGSTYNLISVVLFIMAIIFAIITVYCFVAAGKQQKRYKSIENELNEKFAGNYIFAIGCYGKKGEAGKAAAKTAASALGGALFAGLFGFGTYKIYGSNNPKEYVITDDGLFIGNPEKVGFNLGTMTYFEKGALTNAEITSKKNRITLKNTATGEFFIIDISKNKDVTVEQATAKLEALIQPIESAPVSENAEESEQTHQDPFEE